MITYICGSVYLLAEWELWNIEQLKNTIVWTLSVAFMALYQLFNKPDDFMKEQTFYDFVTPLALTILYLPFLFVVMIYVTYEMVLVRLRFTLPSRKHLWFAVFLGATTFHVRIQLLDRWVSLLQRKEITSYKQIWDAVKEVFFMRRMEKNPPRVLHKQGWSAYEAKDALKPVGLETGLYQEYFDEWSASSPLINIDENILPNRIAYYVNGQVGIATQLKLKLYVNHLASAVEAHERFLQAAILLYEYAMEDEIPVWLANCLLTGEEIEKSHNGNTISVKKEPHLKNKGYELKFMLSYEGKSEDTGSVSLVPSIEK